MEREPSWRRYLRFWRTNAAADIDDEVRFHIESRVAEFVALGMSPEQARQTAADRFGDSDEILKALRTLTHERELTMRRTAWFETIRQDLHFAARQLVRSPGFTLVAVLTLALGIGATTAIFSVVYSVLLRPLPYAAAGDRLLTLRERNGPSDTHGMVVTFGNFGDWEQRARGFEALGAWGYSGFILTGFGDPQQLPAFRVSAGYWKALNIAPVLGRYFTAREDRPDAAHVVVLSASLWHTSFGSDPTIVGRTITLSGTPYTVVGVAPDSYSLIPQPSQIWVPLALTAEDLAEHSDHELNVVGLVRNGTTPEAAVADLTRIETELAAQYPHSLFDGGIIATPLSDTVVGPVKTQLLILFAAVGLVLLIACANVTNLLLARAAVRQTELAIRGALGAGRARIVGQLLAESLLLAGIGGVAGIGLALAGVRFLVHTAPHDVPRLQDAAVNGHVLLFAVVVAVLCGIVFGLFPALRATRTDLQHTLRASGRSAAAAASQRLRSALVVAEVSVTMVLLVGAGLLIRSEIALQHVPPGFDPSNLLVTRTGLPSARYTTPASVAEANDAIMRGIGAQPGVQSVALVSRIPIGAVGSDCGVRPEGSAVGDGSEVDANARTATSNYFATIGVPLLRGRTFAASDLAGGPSVVVINRSLARHLYGDADPIGKRLTHCDKEATWRTVVGVIGDIHASGLANDVTNEVYYPSSQHPLSSMYIVVRGTTPVTALTPEVRRAVLNVDPQLVLSGAQTMDEIIARSMATSRFNMLLLAMLGLAGLLLAAVGIYGVIAYFVTQRTQEIGIRMALGADARRVIGAVVWQAVAIASIGVVIGLVISFAASRVLASSLFGVGAHDPVTFAAVAALLLLVAAAASFIPARRAAAVDPLEALRAG